MNFQSRAFIIIDIAYALIIFAFAFVILGLLQKDISNELKREEVGAYQKANQDLLSNIKQDNYITTTLKTNKNETHRFKKYEGKYGNVVLQRLVIID